MLFRSGLEVVAIAFLINHPPNTINKILRIGPISSSFYIAQFNREKMLALLNSLGDSCYSFGDFSGQELLSSLNALMVEKNAMNSIKVIRLSIHFHDVSSGGL